MLSIAELPKYESYMDSGVDWLGYLPTGWPTVPMKYLLRLVSEKVSSFGSELPYIGMENIESWSGRIRGEPSEVEGLANKFEINDILFGKLRPYLAKVTKVDFEGICSTELLVYRCRGVEAGFYRYFLSSKPFIDLVTASTYGSKMPRANSDFIGNQYLPCPSSYEQLLIAKFLDKKTSQIDEAIAIKEQQIALLKERKQIIIQKAVTQGLDPTVAMKDSGVDWIGEIPAHWELPTKMKYISSLKGRQGWQGLKAEEYRDEGPHVLSSAHFNNYIIDWDKCPRVSYERYLMDENIQLSIGDVLLMKDGANMGKLAFVDHLPGPACLNSHLLLFRSFIDDAKGEPYFYPNFMFFHMMCSEFQDFVKVNGTGATFLGISQESLGNYQVCLPPFDEQKTIVAYLGKEVDNYDQAIAQQKLQIEKLKEYKTTLINSAVTGKIRITPDMVEV